jgi:uncharacterized protein (DUF433 family)
MKKAIPVGELTTDLKQGIPDEELMKKYGLSENGLRNVLERLLKAACDGTSHIEIKSEE